MRGLVLLARDLRVCGETIKKRVSGCTTAAMNSAAVLRIMMFSVVLEIETVIAPGQTTKRTKNKTAMTTDKGPLLTSRIFLKVGRAVLPGGVIERAFLKSGFTVASICRPPKTYFSFSNGLCDMAASLQRWI